MFLANKHIFFKLSNLKKGYNETTFDFLDESLKMFFLQAMQSKISK